MPSCFQNPPILGRYAARPSPNSSARSGAGPFLTSLMSLPAVAPSMNKMHQVQKVQLAELDVEYLRDRLDLGGAPACELRSLPQILSFRGPPLRRGHKCCPFSCAKCSSMIAPSTSHSPRRAGRRLVMDSDSLVSIQRLLPLPPTHRSFQTAVAVSCSPTLPSPAAACPN